MNILADKIKTSILCNNTETAIKDIDELLAQGFNVNDPLPYNTRGFENNWALAFWACLHSNEAILRHLVEKCGASLEVRDSNGYTPLMLAGFHGKFDSFKYMVEMGADLTATSNYEESLEDLVLRKPLNNSAQNSREVELREYVQKILHK